MLLGEQARLRARFLIAMGLIACSNQVHDAPPDDPDGGGIPDDMPVVRADMPQAAWSVEAVPKRQKRSRSRHPLPSCPSGSFCVVGPREGAVGNARAPFDACAQSVPFPREPPTADQQPGGPAWVGGPDVNDVANHYSISFDANWTSHERKAKDAGACCYDWVEPCPGGRPLRDAEGDPILAAIADARDDWSRPAAAHVRDPERARHWARAAQFEHASVASFAQLSLQLLALGAPADLVARCHRAALDEIVHAQLAFTMAAAFGHEPLGPGPLPIAAADLDVTAVGVLRSTVRDGCVAETHAALQARRDLVEAKSTLERDTLARIATDEERHAELAFATVAWLVATFGAELRDALAGELDRLAVQHDAPAVVDAIVLPCLRALATARSATPSASRAELRST